MARGVPAPQLLNERPNVREVRAVPADRAERAVVLLQVQSLLARGALARAARAVAPYAAQGARPELLLSAQIALASAAAAASPEWPGAPTVLANAASTPSSMAADSGVDADVGALRQHAAALQTWVALQPRDALAWTALSQLNQQLGEPLRAIRADAEARLAVGDLAGAADRLRAGQRHARSGGAVDFIEVSVIDARLREVEAQRKKNEADEKAFK